jgi:ribosome-associated toxin RatA of RatAB toxin-antitoxin module
MTDSTTARIRAPYRLGPMPLQRHMIVVDEQTVRAPRDAMFAIACDVLRWPEHLAHYKFVTFRNRARDGGGLVEMSANRPFGPANWPTWWLSEMSVDPTIPNIRFKHVQGITSGMEVEWQFLRREDPNVTHVRIVHAWDGPWWPLIGRVAAMAVIGPVFIHGIASRTLAGLAAAAERGA